MRLLIDNALSPALASLLSSAGLDTLHVRDIGLQHASDDEIFERATVDDLVLVSADTDFATILATRAAAKPSLILFRGEGSRKPDALALLLLANLPQIEEALESGSIVIFEPSRLRIRPLPIQGASRKA